MAVYSKGMPIGTPAPVFKLPATDGGTYSLDSFAPAEVLVVLFTCNHCPYALATELRYPADAFDVMREKAQLAAWPYPYLYDADQSVARAYDAACTPDVFVFDRTRKLVYNGRLDDNWKDAALVTNEELRRAVEATLQHQLITWKVEPSMGCSIKWKAA